MTRHLFKYALLSLALLPFAASAETVRIYVTNSAGDSIHVIDPATNKVVQVFKGPRRRMASRSRPDGARVYVSNEPKARSTCSTARPASSSSRCR